MHDPRVPRARALMIPGEHVKYEIIPPKIQTIPESKVSNTSGTTPISPTSRCNLGVVPFHHINTRNDGTLHGVPIELGNSLFNPESWGNTHIVSPDLKSVLIRFLESISPDTLEVLMMLLKQLLISHNNSERSPQAPVKAPDSPLREAFEFILKTLGTQALPGQSDGNLKSSDAVKMVWNQILKLNKDIFKQVELTISLQKKLTAKEIDSAIQQLIAEGGVIEQVVIEQQKGSGGRAPSPRYRLLWQNPEYSPRPISKVQ